MNSEQLKLLNKMKKLISTGKRHFADRNDRDYLEDLTNIGITVDDAWKIILGLNIHFYFPDEKPKHYRSNDSLTFKRDVNGIKVYIKLKIEKLDNDDETVCLSFHKDNREG